MYEGNEIAILIKTFFRDEALYECVNSIQKYCNDVSYRIYIADDGEINEKKQQFYDRLREAGHIVLMLPFNTGASRSRNLLLERLGNEKYVLRMDDDFCFCQKTNLSSMKLIMDRIEKIGAVGDLEVQMGTGKGSFSGQISSWQGFMDIIDKKLCIRLTHLKKFKYECIEGVRYAKCGFSRNMLLLRRELFGKVCWDENLKFEGEHVDFLLQIHNSGWDLVFTPDSTHVHREDIKYDSNFDKYKQIRKLNSGNEKEIFLNKWGITKVVKVRPAIDIAKAGIIRLVRSLRLGY